MANSQAAELEPEVEAHCVVCGGAGREVICTESELRQQVDYLREFHRRRLRAEKRGGNALADRAEFTQDYSTDVVACTACGLVMRDQRPPDEEVEDAYEDDEYGSERLEALFDAQLQAARPKARQLGRRIGGIARPHIVEVGSFVGGFLAAAGEMGWDAVGIDPGEEVAAFCRTKGLRVHQSAAEEAPIAGESADCVTIWNTFDQLPDPGPTISAVRRWLRPGGLLVIRVPNGAAFRAAIAVRDKLPWDAPLMAALSWNNLLGFPYLYGYSPDTLDRLLARFGFARRALQPDTLVRLADHDTKAWAAWEERVSKGVWKAASQFAPDTAPWFDSYYRARNAGV